MISLQAVRRRRTERKVWNLGRLSLPRWECTQQHQTTSGHLPPASLLRQAGGTTAGGTVISRIQTLACLKREPVGACCTTPARSPPGIFGSRVRGPNGKASPDRILQSIGLSPAATTLTSTCP